MIEFWRLKQGYRSTLSSSAWQCAKKCVFTNHVPRLRLKVNSITQTKTVHEIGRASLYSVKVIKVSRSLQGSLSCCETDCTTFLSLDTQDAERGQLRRARSSLRLTTPVWSRDEVSNICHSATDKLVSQWCDVTRQFPLMNKPFGFCQSSNLV